MRRLAGLCLVLTGCAGVFDLEHLDDPERPPPLELRVNGTAVTHVITNDSQREPKVTDVPTESLWHVILEDGREPTVEQSAGAFTFLRASDTQRYRLYSSVGYYLEIESEATTPALSAPSWGVSIARRPPRTPGSRTRSRGFPRSGRPA